MTAFFKLYHYDISITIEEKLDWSVIFREIKRNQTNWSNRDKGKKHIEINNKKIESITIIKLHTYSMQGEI